MLVRLVSALIHCTYTQSTKLKCWYVSWRNWLVILVRSRALPHFTFSDATQPPDHTKPPSSPTQLSKMAWRNQGITGSNNIPLGRRRFGGDDPHDEDSRTATPASNGGESGFKRGRSPVRGELPFPYTHTHSLYISRSMY